MPLQRLVDSLSPGLRLSSPRSFDLLFEDDLAATVSLHPDGQSVTVDLWCGDASDADEPDRRILVELLLGLNARHPDDPWRWVGLDSRDFILVHGRAPVAALEGDGFSDWLASMVEEARQIRSLVDPFVA